MIRDPSDGSVRENPAAAQNAITEEPSILSSPPADTGLPPLPSKPKDIAKLEKSREWLQNYKSQKGR